MPVQASLKIHALLIYSSIGLNYLVGGEVGGGRDQELVEWARMRERLNSSSSVKGLQRVGPTSGDLGGRGNVGYVGRKLEGYVWVRSLWQ